MPTSFLGYCAIMAFVCFIVNVSVVSFIDYIHDSKVVECDMCGKENERGEMRDVGGYLLCSHCSHYAAKVAANGTWFAEPIRIYDIKTTEETEK